MGNPGATAPSPEVAPGFPMALAPLVPQTVDPLPAVVLATIPPPTFVLAAQALLEALGPAVIIPAMPTPPTTVVPMVIPPPPALPMAPVVVSSTAARAELLKLDSIKDAKAFLDSFETIQYYLHMPEFSTRHPNGSLNTDAANADASQAWEGQLCLAIKDRNLCFLFENKGTQFHGRGFEMLAALTQHCRPDTVSNTFASLLSLFNDVQRKAESILEYRSHFDVLTLELSQCKVIITPLLLVMLFLQGLHGCYANIVEQFRSHFKSIETATADFIMSDVAFHDSFTLVETRKCKLAGGSASTPRVPAVAAANTNCQGNVWQLLFEWLAKYGIKGIKGRWTHAMVGTGIFLICHRNEKQFHVPTQCPLLLDLGLKLITCQPATPSPAPTALAGASLALLPTPTLAPGGRAAAADSGSSTGLATTPPGLSAMATPVIGVAADYDTNKDFTWDRDKTGAAFGGDPKFSTSVDLYTSPSCSHAWVVCANLPVASTSRSISLPG